MTDLESARIFQVVSSFIEEMGLSSPIQADALTYIPLKGGRSAASIFRFELNGLLYVLRLLPPQATQADCMHQIAIAKQAGEMGIGPKVYFIDQHLDAIIMENIKGRTIYPHDFENVHLLSRFAQFLHKLHYSKASFPIATSPFDRFRSFYSRSINAEQLTRAKAVMEKIESVLKLHPITSVPVHLDLNPLNILYANEQFYLVDWVNGGISDPYFDLSTFVIFLDLNEDQTTTFLSHYFGRPPTSFEWDRFNVLLPVRLFVIASAYLLSDSAFEDSSLPEFSVFIREFANGKANYTHQKMGSIALKAGLDYVERANFKKSIRSLSGC